MGAQLNGVVAGSLAPHRESGEKRRVLTLSERRLAAGDPAEVVRAVVNYARQRRELLEATLTLTLAIEEVFYALEIRPNKPDSRGPLYEIARQALLCIGFVIGKRNGQEVFRFHPDAFVQFEDILKINAPARRRNRPKRTKDTQRTLAAEKCARSGDKRT